MSNIYNSNFFAGFRTGCVDIRREFFGNSLLFVFQLYTAHAAVARLRRAQRAQGCSGNVARAPAFSLDSFVHRPKRRKQEKGQGIAYMSATLPKRDSCSLRQVTAKGAEQVRYGMDLIRPLLMEPSASIIPLRPPPPVFSFCGKHCSCFLFVDQEKIGMSGATEV